MLETPIIFIIFNRPDTTRRVFETIRAARPLKLLVVADGPRADREGEAERCAAARAITEDIDWPCEVERNYSETNLGCRNRVASGITWAFEQVEDAIILEDDTVPHPSFFRYCSELLERYRDDERVMVISGNNFQNGIQRGDGSYYFSKYNHCWGWATWRRAWRYFDVEMDGWPEFRNSGFFDSLNQDERERNFWQSTLDRAADGWIDAWSYAWTLACWRNGGLTALPNVNLVSNIGFGEDATHTGNGNSPLNNIASADIGKIRHPETVSRNVEADAYTVSTIFMPTSAGPCAPNHIHSVVNRMLNYHPMIRPMLSKVKRRTKSALGLYHPPSQPVPSAAPSDERLNAVVEKVRPYTMTSVERITALYDAVKYVIENDIPGAFVECGVWRGGSAMVMLETLKQLGVTDREVYLYDTFEGMPPPTNHDRDLAGQSAASLMAADENNRAASAVWAYCELDDVKANIATLGDNLNVVHFVPGKVEETLPTTAPVEIALLRLDTDWYESTRHELVHLFPRLVQGGVVIIDDYGHWRGAKQAVDEYIEQHKLRIFLQRIDYTGRIGIKQK